MEVLTSVKPTLAIGQADTLTDLIDLLPSQVDRPLPVFIVLCDDEIPAQITGKARVVQLNCNSNMSDAEIDELLKASLVQASIVFEPIASNAPNAI
jgi:hypothetical protein